MKRNTYFHQPAVSLRTFSCSLLFIILVPKLLSAQINNCQLALQQEPSFFIYKNHLTDSLLSYDKSVFKECGKFSDTDFELLNGPLLNTVIGELTKANKAPTFQAIIDQINVFKASPDFQRMKDEQNASAVLEKKLYQPANWEYDSQLFKLIGFSDEELSNFHNYLNQHSNDSLPYRKAYVQFKKAEQSTKAVKKEFPDFIKLPDLDAALREAKKNDRPILLYFSCHTCANARKMNAGVLSEPEVVKTIDSNYVAYIAYADEKTPLPEFQQKKSAFEDTIITTVGQQSIELERSLADELTQPTFIILSKKSKVIAKTGYTDKPTEFLHFLQKGIH